MSDAPNPNPQSQPASPANLFRQLIADGDGAPSVMRVATLAVIIPVMIVWSVLSIRRGEFVPIDWNMIGLIASALGAKAVQSFAERGVSPPTNVSEPTTTNP